MELTKKCTRCAETKTLDAFTRHKKSSDGLNQQCRTCTRYKDKQRFQESQARRDGCKQRNAKYRLTDKGRATSKAIDVRHLAKETTRQKRRDAAKRHYVEKPWRVLAGCAVQNAVKTGKLPKSSDVPCCVGGDCYGRNNWHHDSYLVDDRLRVRCMCSRHHQLWHKTNKAIVPEQGSSDEIDQH